MSVTFIVGCARSGTTSLARLLQLSPRVHCLIEPQPNLNLESRLMFDGCLPNPEEVLARDLGPRLEKARGRGLHYVEKQISLVPFMSHLVNMFDCRFVIPVRDGRDVATSLVNWHNQMFPIIYQECRHPADLGQHARQILAQQVGVDPFDHSLPRPPKGDPWHQEWAQLTRFEMVAWYWQFMHKSILRQTAQLQPSRYLIVDYTAPVPDTIRRVYDFLDLPGFDAVAVQALLDQRINSLEDRIAEAGRFPPWRQWAEPRLQRFYDIAFPAMHLLGYEPSPVRPRPPGFGEYWREPQQDLAWYREIYGYRATSHHTFEGWFRNVQELVGPLESVVDVGCGAAVGYADFFRDRPYTGIDLVPQAVELCRAHQRSEQHRFFCSDPVDHSLDVRADLGMSQATIDNTYDVDAFLRSLAKMSRKVVYLSNYRGYFAELADHRYRWDPKMQVFFNDISPARTEEVLREAGFQTVVAFPSATNRQDIAAETVVIASRDKVDPRRLMRGHDLHFGFRPYSSRPSALSRGEVIAAVNAGCAYFSAPDLDLASPLSLLSEVVRDIKGMARRRLGTMEALACGDRSVNLGLRVDVDMDLVAAVEMAEIARRQEAPLSFYLLHTAAYYGQWAGHEFLRHEDNAELYLRLQRGGSEVGLHNDAMHLYLNHGIDGAAALQAELDWLRSAGLRVRGTSAHNAAPVYGVENFEVFSQHNVSRRPFVERDHIYVPLGTLDQAACGLTYEAGDARPVTAEANDLDGFLAGLPAGDFLRDPRWFRTYILDNPYCSWGYDYRIWLLGRDMWAVAGHDRERRPVFRFPVSWSEAARFLEQRDASERVCITLHPVYLGFRDTAGSPPLGSHVLA